MIKLKQNAHRDIFILTRFPEEFYEDDATNDVFDIDFNQGAVVDLADMLDSTKKAIGPFFTEGRPKNLDV